MKFSKSWAAAAAMVVLSGAVQAALVNRGGGMIYDTTLNITWLSDWNYAQTSGDDANGLMNWLTAKNWADNLVYGGYDDWRLPTSLNADGTGPCMSFNCSGSEMGHMFYVDWDATAGNPFSSGTDAANLALFSNVQSYAYWSGTGFSPNNNAWFFGTISGHQNFSFGAPPNQFFLYAVAVRPGDVGAPVPAPQTLALALLALAGIAAARRRSPEPYPAHRPEPALALRRMVGRMRGLRYLITPCYR